MAIRVAVRGGILYLRGTVTVEIGEKKASREIYRSLRRAAVAPGAKRWAERRAAQYQRALEHRLEREIIEGPRPKIVSWNAAYAEYRRRREDELRLTRPDWRPDTYDIDIDIAWKLTEFFRSRGVADRPLPLSLEDVNAYFRERHIEKGHGLATTKRDVSTYVAVMNVARSMHEGRSGIADFPRPTLPERDIYKVPVNKWLFAEEVQMLIAEAPPHLKPIEAAAWGGGRRHGELYWLPRTAFVDAAAGAYLSLGVTKDGRPKIVPLPGWAAAIIREYLAGRRDEKPQLFLTHTGEAWARPKRGTSTRCKTAFRGMKKRAVAKLIAMGKLDRADVMRRVTPHWARHNAASHLRMNPAVSDAALDEFMGWTNDKMKRRYGHLSPQFRAMAEHLDFDPARAPAVQPVKKTG